MGLYAGRTLWPLPNTCGTLLWCAPEISAWQTDNCASWSTRHGYGCNYFLIHKYLTAIFSLYTKEAKRLMLWAVHFSTALEKESLRFFVFLVGCDSPAWEYHATINRRWLRHLIPALLIYQLSQHYQIKPEIWEKKKKNQPRRHQPMFPSIHWIQVANCLAFLPTRSERRKVTTHWHLWWDSWGFSASLGGTSSKRKSLAGGSSWTEALFYKRCLDAMLVSVDLTWTLWPDYTALVFR